MPSKSVIAAACDACIRSVIIDRGAPRAPRDHRVRFDPELQAKVTRLTRTYDGLNAVTAQLDESFEFHLSRVEGKDDAESHLAFGAWFLRERLINLGPGRQYREGPSGLIEL